MIAVLRRNAGIPLPGLRPLREERRIPRTHVARALKIDASYLWKLESGRNGASLAVAEELAAYFNVPLKRLRTKPVNIA